jgi:hypothetical protein
MVSVGLLVDFGCAAIFCVGCWGFHWALEPLKRAGKGRQCAMQFSLADILCLFVPVQLLLGTVHSAMQHSETRLKEWEWDLLIVWLTAWIWWDLVRKLSRADIHAVWQRSVILMVAPLVFFVAFGMLYGQPMRISHLTDMHPVVGVFVLLGTAAVLGGVIYGLRRFTRAITRAGRLPGDTDNWGEPTDTDL